MSFEDILYEVKDGVATITINRPERYNAFRGQTCLELIEAFNRAGWDRRHRADRGGQQGLLHGR
jgi:2-ketocyclohexanecarboxyl-CoA hydrolase